MEKWKVIDYYRKIFFDEGIKPRSGRIKVALIYPNIYEIAIQNLGYQYVYSELNKLKDVACERFVLDFYEDNLSIENQRFLQEFDIIAVSINYEEDVLNLIKFLYLQKIPVFSDDRGDKYPPIISGGALGLINPNILKDIVDIQLLGDFKPMLDTIAEYFIGFEKKDIFIKQIC
ncbi:MAG: radical SAM protein, partial [Calditerrivibrio sp.]|nr:radical SAM protein [Calditerrivibrio sp.]